VHLLDAPTPAEFMNLVQQQWLPAMGTPGAYTRRGEQFDSVVKYLTGGDLPFREQGLSQFYTRDLGSFGNPAAAPESAPGLRAVSTRNETYDIDDGLGLSAAELNAGVRRFDPAPGARAGVFADFTGHIDVPVLSIHDTGDGFVPFKHEQDYRQKTLSAGTSDLLVQRAIRRAGHCNFSDDERNRAFDDLITWMQTGARPGGDDVLTADTAHIGLVWTSPLEPGDPLAP
jgi:pimeloyl-ACP methyl ester carboxylesterase